MRTENLVGKNCLLTGATGGLGRELARSFWALGANLLITGRRQESLLQLTKDLMASATEGQVAIEIVANLANPDEVSALATNARIRMGCIDVLVNNAAVFPVKPIDKTMDADLDECLAVNLRAPFMLARDLSSDMVAAGWGRIVNIGSSSAYAGFRNTSLYCASKHALLGLSRALHDELKGAGIRTFCISPGSIQTEMGQQVEGQDFSTFILPEDVAHFVAHLITYDGNMVCEESRLNRVTIR